MVSKFDQCLDDLLYRVRIGELKMDIVAIVSNHPREALSLGMIDGIPYHYLPVAKDSKPQQEARIKALVEETGATLIRSEEHTSELQSLMRISYAVFCLKKKKNIN